MQINIDTHLIKEVISSAFIFSGVAFMLLATIGIVRLPDFYIRMSAITKGSTLGVGLIVSGIGIYFNTIEVTVKVIAIISFIVLTSPVAAHVLGRTAIRMKIPFWIQTDTTEFEPYLKEHNVEQAKSEDTDKTG